MLISISEIKSFFSENTKLSNTYFVVLLFLIASLPFSVFVISVSEFALLGVWIFSLDFKTKFDRLFKNKPALIFISIYFIYIVGLLYTSDFKWATHSLKTKIPIALLPLVLISIPSFSAKQIKALLYFFVVVIFAKTLQTSINIVFTDNPFSDIRKLSFRLSHIRFSIFIVFSIFIIIYYNFIKETTIRQKIFASGAVAWFIMFLFIVQSITGIVIFLTISYILILFFTLKKKKILLSVFSILIPVGILAYLFVSVLNFYDTEEYNFEKFEKTTQNGNWYWHDTTNLELENGYYTWIYICEQELSQEWNKRSKIYYDSLDNAGHNIKFTLIRYLTSKGLRKDSAGIAQLSEQDVLNIENSIANYRFYNKFNFNNRIYKIIWQFDIYLKGGNPAGHSVTQRFEFLKNAFNLIKKNPLLGVGTGDIKKQIQQQYDEDNSMLKAGYRKNPHNQYVTLTVTFGLIGALWIVFALIFPFVKNKKFKEFLPTVFFLITLLSMLNEDPWEMQVSVTFFAVFFTLLILQPKKTD